MIYKNIFKQGNIGNLTLKNRIVMPAIGCSLADKDGFVNEAIIKYYEERAAAGCGLIITEIARVDDEAGVGLPNQLRATTRDYIDGLKKLTDRIHKYDTKIFLQLHHPGRQTSSKLLVDKNIIAPSPIPCKTIGETPDEMTERQIQVLINRFTIGAKIAQDAGMDGVELHAAHGYLISQFISPHTNKRKDLYGGNPYNNLNFLKEIIEGIRQFCGEDFPISVRINGDDFVKGGLTKEQAIETAKIISTFPIDALNISSGTYESSPTIIEPIYYEEGWKKDLAKDIKKVVDLPIIACNNIKTPYSANNLLEEDVSDFIALGRSQLADSQFVHKAKNDDEENITPCISCLHCIETVSKGLAIECAVNPRLGKEYKYPLEDYETTKEKKDILVIGGGPAGLKAAIVLAKRGFNVSLHEKESYLGGSLYLASTLEYKSIIKDYIHLLERKAVNAGVKINLNSHINMESIRKSNPDIIIISMGGKNIIPNIDNIDSENILLAKDVLANKMTFQDEKVLIVGSGMTGLETAEYISNNNKITIIESEDTIGPNIYKTLLYDIIERLEDNNIELMPSTKINNINKNKVSLIHKGKSMEKDYDHIILATGIKSIEESNFIEEIKKEFDEVHIVGDSKNPNGLYNAIWSGFKTGYDI